ncbi:hypothetical protein [Verminephrobacter aporrectodeae]|uniref:hypothetical protein n=1 Tax=Verminephrobacter aporrectodeae TaxID=1110389 RepID=UPI00145F731C|nr:hypothetical protein [Verminephrobacter aporrectodeae]
MNLIVVRARIDSVFFERLAKWLGLSPKTTKNVIDCVGLACLILLLIIASSATSSK